MKIFEESHMADPSNIAVDEKSAGQFISSVFIHRLTPLCCGCSSKYIAVNKARLMYKMIVCQPQQRHAPVVFPLAVVALVG